jgi:UDP-4-amino-4,6-dideoxy-N-acetyl-beta-L-altrosamine transaminase
LHVACLALGLGPGDVLWTVTNTFVASANCALYCGASVDFVDIDSATWNMSVDALEAKLVEAHRAGRLPKVVVPVHFSGQPTDQEAIRSLSREYGFRVLEDASHAVGATHRGEPVGSCRWSDIAVLSFHPVKIITTGEGGMTLTNDDELAERMRMFRSHGITRDPRRLCGNGFEASVATAGAAPASWYYEQQLLGFNYRMTDVAAALGASQLARLDAYVARRNALAARYDRAFRDLPLQIPTVRPDNRSAFHLYVIRLTPDRSAEAHRQVFDRLRNDGIGVNLHYMPVHLQPYYRGLGFSEGQFPEAEAYGRTAITLPLYATLPEREQDRVIESVTNAVRNLS